MCRHIHTDVQTNTSCINTSEQKNITCAFLLYPMQETYTVNTIYPFPPFSLAAVYDDVFRLYPLLQHALFRMLTSTPKQAWRLNLKVANALSVVVE